MLDCGRSISVWPTKALRRVTRLVLLMSVGLVGVGEVFRTVGAERERRLRWLGSAVGEERALGKLGRQSCIESARVPRPLD